MGAFNNADRPRYKKYSINAKEGKLLYYNRETGQSEPLSGVYGVLKAVLPSKREISGTPKDFLNFVLIDPVDASEARVEVSRYSKFSLEMLARLNNCDPKKPVCFMPRLSTTGGENGTPKRTVVFAQVYEVLSVDAKGFPQLKSIEAYYGEEHGNKMPRSEVVMVGGKPFMQNGKEVRDDSWVSPMIDGLLSNVRALLGQEQGQAEGEAEGHQNAHEEEPPVPSDGGVPAEEIDEAVDRPAGG